MTDAGQGRGGALQPRHVLDGLRSDAERRGWAFYERPTEAVLPDFLSDHRPDAMAVTPDGGIVIEFTSRQDLAEKGRLADVARKIAEHPGWSLRVFYANPSDPAGPEAALPTLADLVSGIDEVRALGRLGQPRAALVMAWATLEAMARLAVAGRGHDLVRPLSPVQAVQILVQEGCLDDEDAGRLRRSARLRNDVVHGGVSTVIAPEDVGELVEALETVAGTLRQAA